MILRTRNDESSPPIVLVDWVDSVEVPGWRAIKGTDESGLECQTVGWLLTADAITVASSANFQPDEAPSDSISGIMIIPRSAIQQIRELDTMNSCFALSECDPEDYK